MTIPLISRAEGYRQRIAVVDSHGSYTYQNVLDASARVAATLLHGRKSLQQERVAFYVTPGFPWVAVQWGIWRAGGVAVPLPLGYTAPELEYILDDTRPVALVFDSDGESKVTPLRVAPELRLLSSTDASRGELAPLPEVDISQNALILYTSGTTSRPKGVVTTHSNIEAQVKALVEAWEWSANDRILLCLPLSHVHGIINVVTCALWSGATCDMLPKFDAEVVWQRIEAGDLSLFMAVPTIYTKLIAAWEATSVERQALLSAGCRCLRLMVSGSAALPVATLERWQKISGHTLLERYGMTEIGMGISNPLCGKRVPGSIGVPLPTVEVRLVDEAGKDVEPGTPGEIEIRGPSVFKEYWEKPEATQGAFRNGWFRTGDMGIIENGVYRILGRTSIDILKTGGQKLSALEVEETLREHPSIGDCAVVGVPDPEWGQRVGVAVVLRKGTSLDLNGLRAWGKERLANYKIPSLLMVVDALPRNTMGKVTKPAVTALFQTKNQ